MVMVAINGPATNVRRLQMILKTFYWSKHRLIDKKGAKGLDEWLQSNHAYRCEYIERFVDVIEKYGLLLIPSEKRVINRMQKACTELARET
tara:strand:+ start:269 stop:541 length:273 start_codon:yes stop_codon:yes gene_type:complete